jgi:hypothetical protein
MAGAKQGIAPAVGHLGGIVVHRTGSVATNVAAREHHSRRDSHNGKDSHNRRDSGGSR